MLVFGKQKRGWDKSPISNIKSEQIRILLCSLFAFNYRFEGLDN